MYKIVKLVLEINKPHYELQEDFNSRRQQYMR